MDSIEKKRSTGVGLQVVFGNGPVGTSTARHLLSEGCRVRILSRSGRCPPELDAAKGLEARAVDALDPAAVRSASVGASHVYHCVNVPYQHWKAVLPVIHENLRSAALAHGAVLAVAQNLYMYARGVAVISEATPTQPPSRKGRLQLALHEKLVEAEKDGLVWTAVRASDYYGPGAGMQSVFGTDRFLNPLYAGKRPAMIGNLDMPHTYTYVGDYGRALAMAALNPVAHGKAWIVPNDRTPTTREMADLFAAAFGRGPGLGHLPRAALAAAGIFNPLIRELLEVLHQKEEPYTVDGSLFKTRFGFEPTALEAGVRATLDWYEARGQARAHEPQVPSFSR